MSQVATAAVVEEKMVPIAKSEPTQQLVVTGQYLFDNFVRSSDEQITKMGMIRNLVDIADALQIKGACDKMVELAVLIDYPEGKPKKADRRAKEQSAMNARTVIQQAWGALKYARPVIDGLGYDDKTGYQDMRVLAKKALDTAKLNWKGEPLKTDEDREKARLQRQNKAQVEALAAVQKENPFDSRLETLQEWNQRTFNLALDEMNDAQEQASIEKVEKCMESLIEKYDDNELCMIAQAIAAKLGVDIIIHEAEEETRLEPAKEAVTA